MNALLYPREHSQLRFRVQSRELRVSLTRRKPPSSRVAPNLLVEATAAIGDNNDDDSDGREFLLGRRRRHRRSGHGDVASRHFRPRDDVIARAEVTR
ncbi:unnamed protein product [Lampetra planeri]